MFFRLDRGCSIYRVFLLGWGCSRCFFDWIEAAADIVYFCWAGAASDGFLIEAAADIVYFCWIGAASYVFCRLDRGCSRYRVFLLDRGLQQMFFRLGLQQISCISAGLGL